MPRPPVRDREQAIQFVRNRLLAHPEGQSAQSLAEHIVDALLPQPDPRPMNPDEESRLLGRLVDAEERAERTEESLRAVTAAAGDVVDAYWPEFDAALSGLTEETAAKYLLDAPIARLRTVLSSHEGEG